MLDDDEVTQIQRLANVAMEAMGYLNDCGATPDQAAIMAGHIAQAMQLWWRTS